MIRKITAGDVPRCVQIIRDSFQTVADEFGFTAENAPRFTAFAISGERLLRQMENQRPMYVYEQGGEVVGYYSLLPGGDGSCELNNLCVIPTRRHDGIGGRLLESAFQAARELGCGRMEIGIVEENQVLRAWYEAYGFVHTYTQKFGFFPFTCGYMEKNL